MIPSYLNIALSLFCVPLALGRPTSAPTHKVYQPAAPAEPNALLGRHYLVHDHRDASRPRIYTYAISVTTTSPRPQQTPRRRQPFAKYFADRSGDMWVHERPRAPAPILRPRAADEEDEEATMKYVDYVSHVGPFAYKPPAPPPSPSTVTVTVLSSQPSPTLVDYAEASSNSTASVETTMPVMDLATANATVTSTSTDPSPTTATVESVRGKKVRPKARAKVHKGGKKEYKEKRRY
ncbi:hypothetical protein V8D89_003780 [Ganoderma adspersum]